ncbi:substrate-binding domain-containing protein [Psychroflexus montanilacus]|uniref:substrate-binding domain-containing protein n=1 Tax=Psychroflexus montanilacus TaxID=2873598 RepID=UPI001CCC019E|nr:substrate-binding domain-containing protein [Psychroflexus montanilacus]MBZ9651184.1 substrate-binding domain-containing protein [Psychroflexus montanilacus]
MRTLKIGGVPEHFNLPWHLCIEGGDFEKNEIEVDWTDFHGGTGEMSEALKAGTIDIAVMLTEGSIKEICDGSPFKIIQTYVKSPLMWGIHVHANSNYHRVEDLKNQTAAISRFGSGSHLMTYVHANNQDWDTEDLNFKTTQNLSGAKASLKEGTADYFLWEHFTTKPLVDNGTFRRLGDEPTPWPCFVIVTTEKFLKKNSKLVPLLLEPLNKKSNSLKSMEHIEEMISKRYDLKIEDVKEWLKITEWSQQQLSENDVHLTQKRLQSLSLVETEKTYTEFIFA